MLSRRSWGILAAVAGLAGALLAAPPSPARATSGPHDHVLYWNNVLLRAYRQAGGPPGPLARAGAMMHVAIYDAVNSVMYTHNKLDTMGAPYLSEIITSSPADQHTAIDYAAYDVLKAVFPSQSFDADLTTAQSGTQPGTSQDVGHALGDQVAQAVLNARANDAAAFDPTYTVNYSPGWWRPTGSSPAANPNWGKLKPFALTSGSQFRPAWPNNASSMAALLASPEYAAQVNEIKDVGSANSTSRTADQTQAAWFWANDLDGTYKPPGQLYALTQTLSQQQGISQEGNAKLFAMLSVAMADASVSAWDSKYSAGLDLWRPVSAIQLADSAGNTAVTADPNWQPLSADRAGNHFTPPFPSYVSGHATFAGAWGGVMRYWFGTDNVAFTGTTDDPHAVGVTRSFPTFTAAENEDALSRLWLGVHYRWDSENGQTVGHNVAGYVTANTLKPNSAASPQFLRGFGTNSAACASYQANVLADHRWTSANCVDDTATTGSFDLYVQ